MTNKIKISSIKPNPDNPRIVKDDKFYKLVESIKQFGEKMFPLRPIVVDENNIILGGNMRYKALKHLKYKTIPDTWIKQTTNLTDDEKKEFIIKDNVGFGLWDWELLSSDWDADLLDSWGMDIPEFEFQEIEAQEDNYEEPEQIQVDVVHGDLIEFVCQDGRVHRLICGDSTCSDMVAKLVDGEKIEIGFTSPPYNTKENAKLSPHQKNGTKYNLYSDNLQDNEYLKFLIDCTKNSLLFCKYSFINIQSLSGNKTVLIDFLYNLKEVYADTLIWQKQNSQPAMAKNVLNSQFEYVHCFSKKANRSIGTKEFRGTLSNVIEISKQCKNKIKQHNATFPIEFCDFFVNNFCKKTVLDLFLGSGTTMIVAEQLKKICYGMELDPKYCQIIIDRMRKFDSNIKVKINNKEYKTEEVFFNHR